MTAALKAIDNLSEFIGRLAAWMFFAVGLFVTYEVVMRYVFIKPTIWVDEVSRIIQIWATYMAAAFALKNRQLIVIDIAFKDPTTLARKLVETLSLLIILVFALVTVAVVLPPQRGGSAACLPGAGGFCPGRFGGVSARVVSAAPEWRAAAALRHDGQFRTAGRADVPADVERAPEGRGGA